MRLLGALFWLFVMAVILGFSKAAVWLFMAFVVVLFVRAPFAVLLGALLGISFFGRDDC